jgi:hypothetical protein
MPPRALNSNLDLPHWVTFEKMTLRGESLAGGKIGESSEESTETLEKSMLDR